MPNPDTIFPVEIDTSRLNSTLNSLREAMIGQGQDISTILVDEQRKLTRTIVNFTAPIPATNARKAGEEAVRKDLYSLISEAKPRLIDRIGSQYGLKDIDTWTQSAGGKVHIVWSHLNPSGSNLAELHDLHRSSRTGRPPRIKTVKGEWRSRIVVDQGVREPYVRLVQSHVGRLKATWAYAAAQLGDKYPAWIARHFGHVASKAKSESKLDGENPYIIFGGRGPNFARDKAKINAAVKFRVQAIMRLIKLVVSDYAKNVADGMKARAAAHKHKNREPAEAVD